MLDSRSVLPNHIPNACYKRDTSAPFSTRAWPCFSATSVAKSAIVAGTAWRYLGYCRRIANFAEFTTDQVYKGKRGGPGRSSPDPMVR